MYKTGLALHIESKLETIEHEKQEARRKYLWAMERIARQERRHKQLEEMYDRTREVDIVRLSAALCSNHAATRISRQKTNGYIEIESTQEQWKRLGKELELFDKTLAIQQYNRLGSLILSYVAIEEPPPSIEQMNLRIFPHVRSFLMLYRKEKEYRKNNPKHLKKTIHGLLPGTRGFETGLPVDRLFAHERRDLIHFFLLLSEHDEMRGHDFRFSLQDYVSSLGKSISDRDGEGEGLENFELGNELYFNSKEVRVPYSCYAFYCKHEWYGFSPRVWS